MFDMAINGVFIVIAAMAVTPALCFLADDVLARIPAVARFLDKLPVYEDEEDA